MLRHFWTQYGSWLRPIPWIVLLVTLLAGLLGDMGIFRLRELHAEQQRLHGLIAERERQNFQLRSDVKQLRSDPGYLERLVREELRYVREGEIVYQFQEERPPVHSGQIGEPSP